MKAPDRELRRLVDAWHDGTISREDGLRLEMRMETDPEAIRYWLEISEIEAALPSATAGLEIQAVEPSPRRFAAAPWLRIAAVFVLGLFCGSLLWPRDRVKPTTAKRMEHATPPPSAVITGMLGVSWDKGSEPQRIGIPAGAEASSFASGLMELTFASGTRAVIEGPAGFQVAGPNSMRLAYGRVVANVPKGAEGFTINSRDGQVVDLGTEFAIHVPRDSAPSTLGVFRGKIEFHPRDAGGEVLRLEENQALSANVSGGRTIPFQRSDFHRELPSREFSWELEGASAASKPVDFDVSHLIWKPGRYRAVCKWMAGSGGVVIQSAELLRDGVRIAANEHPGYAGDIHQKPDNIYDLQVPTGVDRPGRWTLRLHLVPKSANPAQRANSRGVVLFEEGMATAATATDFAGVWEYLYNGRTYHRTYHPDGTAELVTKEGSAPTFRAAHWRVEDGQMILDVPEDDGTWVAETHLLRDAKTLIFANQPYQNARRIGPAPAGR